MRPPRISDVIAEFGVRSEVFQAARVSNRSTGEENLMTSIPHGRILKTAAPPPAGSDTPTKTDTSDTNTGTPETSKHKPKL